MKTYTVETDLVFIRKNDLVNNGGQRFEKTVDKEETYIVSTTEATTGLCRLNYVKVKAAAQVTPIVIKHIRSIAKALKVHPRTMAYRSDFGGEFDLAKIKAVIPDAQNVKVAASVEKKNQDAQRVFYRILKSRRSVAIPDALQQTEKLLNSTYNRVHKATPDELVAKSNKEFNIKTYNQGRKSYIAGDTRLPFVVGQRVRIQIKKDKGLDLKFKSYKGDTFSRRVYIIKKVTKSKPFRYWVNSKWLTQDKLKATEAEDEKTKQLVKDRDNAQAEADKKVEEKREAEEAGKRKAQEVVKEKEIAAGTRRRTRRRNPEQDKKRLEREARMKLLDEQLQADEDEVQAAKARKEGVSPRRRRRKRVVRGSKYERDGEEEWKPHRRKPRIRRV